MITVKQISMVLLLIISLQW